MNVKKEYLQWYFLKDLLSEKNYFPIETNLCGKRVF